MVGAFLAYDYRSNPRRNLLQFPDFPLLLLKLSFLSQTSAQISLSFSRPLSPKLSRLPFFLSLFLVLLSLVGSLHPSPLSPKPPLFSVVLLQPLFLFLAAPQKTSPRFSLFLLRLSFSLPVNAPPALRLPPLFLFIWKPHNPKHSAILSKICS